MEPISLDAHPSTYRHWSLAIDGSVATLTMNVKTEHAEREG
jgi:hypothetical protein